MQLAPGIFTQVHFVIMNISKVLGFACGYWIILIAMSMSRYYRFVQAEG